MSDLTKRLREITRIEKLTSPQQWDVDEAADLIERLSAQLAEAERKGREAGMREAADIANQHGSVESIAQKIESAILAAIGEGK